LHAAERQDINNHLEGKNGLSSIKESKNGNVTVHCCFHFAGTTIIFFHASAIFSIKELPTSRLYFADRQASPIPA
jgi:hypothetical protein